MLTRPIGFLKQNISCSINTKTRLNSFTLYQCLLLVNFTEMKQMNMFRQPLLANQSGKPILAATEEWVDRRVRLATQRLQETAQRSKKQQPGSRWNRWCLVRNITSKPIKLRCWKYFTSWQNSKIDF